jgi:hypothetical protein
LPQFAGNFEQGLGAGIEEQVIDEPLVLQSKRDQFSRQSEDGMDVACRQQSEPGQLGIAVFRAHSPRHPLTAS